MNRTETQELINIRAWKDPAFRKELLSSPHEALKDLGMKHVPPSLKIKVMEEATNTWYIILHAVPPNVQNLSDEQLKQIAAAGSMSSVSEMRCGAG